MKKENFYESPDLEQITVKTRSVFATSPGWDGAIDNLNTYYDENTELE